MYSFSIEGGAGVVVPEVKKGKGKKRDAASSSTSNAMAMLIKDFGIEYSVSGRASW